MIFIVSFLSFLTGVIAYRIYYFKKITDFNKLIEETTLQMEEVISSIKKENQLNFHKAKLKILVPKEEVKK